MKLLLVRAGSGRFAIAAEAVQQILEPALDADFALAGGESAALYRGARLPVVDLRPRSSPDGRPAAVYVVLRDEARCAALAVDAAEAIHEVGHTAIAPLPGFIFARPRLVRGLVEVEGVPHLLLDEGKIP